MATSITYSAGARAVVGFSASEDYTYTYEQIAVSPPSSSTPGVVKDANVDVVTYTSALYNYTFTFNYPLWQPAPTITVLSGNAVVSGNTVQSTGIGPANVLFSGFFGDKGETFQMAGSGSYVLKLFSGTFVPGSLSHHIYTNMIGYATSKTPDNNVVQRWTSITPAITASGFSAVNNANLITGTLDLSWLGARRIYPDDPNGRFDGGSVFPCALISGRHVVVANHVGFPPRIIFQRKNGTFVQASVVASANPKVAGNDTDMQVGYLDTDLSGLVDPVLIAPAFGTHSIYNKLPLLTTSAVLKYRVPGFISLHNDSAGSSAPSAVRYYGGQKTLMCGIAGLGGWGTPPWPEVAAYWFDPYTNDSSSMVFFPVMQGGTMKCMLMSDAHGAYAGPAFSDFRYQPVLIQTMRDLAASQGDNFQYDLTYADLSAFPSF